MFNPYAIAMNKRGQYDFEKKAKEKISGSVEMTAPNISSSSEGNTSPQSEKKINIDLQNFVPSVINPEITAPVIGQIEPVEIEFDQNWVTKKEQIEPILYNPDAISQNPVNDECVKVTAEIKKIDLTDSPIINNPSVENTGLMTTMQHIAQAMQSSKPRSEKPNDDEYFVVDNNPIVGLSILSQQAKNLSELFKDVKELSLQDKIQLKGLMYEAMALKLQFARGSEERKKLAATAKLLKSIIAKLPAQDKTEIINGLYKLAEYDSDGETQAYDKFRTKDELRKSNQITQQQIAGQIKTNLDAAAALQAQIDKLVAEKLKMCTAHDKLQSEADTIEDAINLMHSLEEQDYSEFFASKESATTYLTALKNELTEAERMYTAEKDATRKVALLTAFNDKKKTNSPIITEQEKLVTQLTTDLGKMDKRLNPSQNNNNTSYLSLSGLTGYFWGSKQAQPTIEDKK